MNDDINFESIESHFKNIDTIVQNECLVCLSDNEYYYKGINILERFEEIYPNKNFNQYKNINDIILITKDLKILTSHLFLYQPYINNPLNEFRYFNDKKYYTYFQNQMDWYYSTYSSCCYEKLYNYWDRIGDRLSISFDTKIHPRGIGFNSVMSFLSKNNKNLENEYFINLLEFWKNDFKKFNRTRKDIVHYYQLETSYKNDITNLSNNKDDVSKLWEWKNGLPMYFKKQLVNCSEGFYNMVMFEKSIKFNR